MGYACPVCGDPQADGRHLADHLAFTAMLGDDAHGAWLDEHAPDWADADPAALAGTVTDHADETDFPQVFEDTTDGTGRDHGHRRDGRHDARRDDDRRGHDSHDRTDAAGDGLPPGGVVDVGDALAGDDEPVEDVLAEARELTRRRHAGGSGEESGPADATDEADDEPETDATDEADDEPGTGAG